MTLRFRSCEAVFNKNFRDMLFNDAVPEGTYCFRRQTCGDWTGWSIWILMPYEHPIGARSVHGLRICGAGEPRPPRPSWVWDGDPFRPTLTPSIRCGPKGGPTHWHGHLTAGVVDACE